MGSKLMEKLSDGWRDIREKLKRLQEKGSSGQAVLTAGFTITLIIIIGVLVFTTRTGYKEPVEASVTEENLFELQLEDEVKGELQKGLSSVYSAVSDKHLEGIYHNMTDSFIPFGVDVYEVLTNRKDRAATIEDNGNELVMAGNGQQENTGAGQPAAQAQAEPATEAQAEPVTEVQAEPVTEAPTESVTEAPTEPVTETPTEPVTEAPTEPEITVISADPEPYYQPGVFIYGDFYDEEERGVVTSADSGYSYPATGDEYYWLYQIVEAEAGNQDEVGKILVVNVILNRVYSATFPNSIKDVIFQARGSVYQFQPVKNGRIYSVVPSDNTISCVNRALNGEDYSQGALYFACKTSKYSWFNTSLTFLFVHGDHYFYK